MSQRRRTAVFVPKRTFLWTIDQIATMLALSEARVRQEFLYYPGRSSGQVNGRMIARNINLDQKASPEWRVSDEEWSAFLRRKGFRAELRS